MANALKHATQGTSLTQVKYESASGSHVFSIEHHASSDTLTKQEMGSFHTNLTATTTIALTLPNTTTSAGCVLLFGVMAAQVLRIDPGSTGAIYINGAKQTDDKYIWADDEGESVLLINDGNGDWASFFATGTWGVEA